MRRDNKGNDAPGEMRPCSQQGKQRYGNDMQQHRTRVAEQEKAKDNVDQAALFGDLHYLTGRRIITALNHSARISSPASSRVIQTPRIVPITQHTRISACVLIAASVWSVLIKARENASRPFANGKSVRTDGWARIEPMVAIVASKIAVSSSSRERRRSEKRGVLRRRESRATRCMMRAARSTGSATSLRLCTL